MNRDFSYATIGKLQTLQSQTLQELGFEHGFIGADLRCTPESLREEAEVITAALHVEEFALLHQVHGNDIAPITPSSGIGDYSFENWDDGRGFEVFPAGDAFFYSFTDPATGDRSADIGRRVALTIRTADCVPIILAGDRGVALIHAGWQGVAKNIVTSALAYLRPGEGSRVYCVIGPAAGGADYEVGADVVEAIGEAAQVRSSDKQGKWYLSLADTIQQQLLESLPADSLVFVDSGVSTMTSASFHSYRRDGQTAGRNLSYLVVSVK